MIGYALLGTNDLEKSTSFYEEMLQDFGVKRVMETDRMVMWSSGDGAMFGVCNPSDGGAASNGNGTMVAIRAADQAMVQKLHDKAKSMGLAYNNYTDPSENDMGFCGVYIRDPDQNKVCFFTMRGM